MLNRKDSITFWHIPIIMALSLLIDILGDPPNRWHPVAWMGSTIAAARKHSPREGIAAQFIYGAGLAVGGVLAMVGVGRLLAAVLKTLPFLPAIVLEAIVLKMTLSLSGLSKAGDAVRVPLERGDLPTARQQLSWHLVSRDTAELSEAQVTAATVESLAENTSDGVIAPLFYYTLFGLPGALAYRFLNTADAMLGYRDAAREWLGKASARLDDGANLLPARITAALFVLGAPLVALDGRMAFSMWQRDARQTDSPNAGHPMSAMAGALGVELDKVGQYNLGAGLGKPQARDIGRSMWLVRLASVLSVVFFGLAAWLFGGRTHAD